MTEYGFLLFSIRGVMTTVANVHFNVRLADRQCQSSLKISLHPVPPVLVRCTGMLEQVAIGLRIAVNMANGTVPQWQ